MSEARLNPEYLEPSRQALAHARENFRVAIDCANRGNLRKAGAELVAAGEEVARAILLHDAYEDLATFDPNRREERMFVDEEELRKSHRLKYVLLTAWAFAIPFNDIRSRAAGTSTQSDEAPTPDPITAMRAEYPNEMTLVETLSQLEELRQGNYSGPSSKGTSIPLLDRATFDRLAGAVEAQLQWATYQQEVYVRTPGELAELQSKMPGVLKWSLEMTRLIKEGRTARQAEKRGPSS